MVDVIEPAFHTGSRGLAARGFGNTKPYDILAHMHLLCVKPSLTELEGALLRLNEPMNRSHTIEVMLQGMVEVQIFLLANPEEDRQQSSYITRTRSEERRVVLVLLDRDCLCGRRGK